MTWETKDLSKLPMTPLYAGLMVLLLGSFAFFEGTPPPSLETRCEQMGGEWLHGSAAPTCITKDGAWLVFNEGADDFVTPGSVDEIALAPQVLGSNVVYAATQGDSCEGSFEDYLVEGIFGNRPARPDFSTWPDATKYTSAITKDVARGSNFAGHYTVSSWGCPEFDGCEGHAIVDNIDGKILSYGITSSEGVEYDKDSKLLIVGRDGSSERYVLHEDEGALTKCE